MPGLRNDKNQPQNFVSSASLKNYAVATGSLTLVINSSLYIYKIITGNNMPNALLISIALVLSILYIFSFFKREDGLTTAQYIWITFLNSLMLFTSISGVNGMLDSARQQFNAQNTATTSPVTYHKYLPVTESSVGGFFKHLIFPTHGWFNIAEADQTKTEEVVTSAIASIETTQKLADTLIQQKSEDIHTIDTLQFAIDTLHSRFIKTLELCARADSMLRRFQNLNKTTETQYKAVAEIIRAVPQIETGRETWQQQKQQQLLQQKQQQQQIQQLQQHQQKLQQQWRQLQKQASYNLTKPD